MNTKPLMERVEERIRDWNVVVQDIQMTPSSFVAFGTQGNRPVVLKVVRQPGDEWHCGDVLAAFNGQGMVRVYESMEGAVLLERLNPGTSIASLSLAGRDEEATEIIASVIEAMLHTRAPLNGFVTVVDWGRGFARYLASGDQQIPQGLVEQAQHLYAQLGASQQAVRLLHGDLQHYNILFDADREWVAIDPKGVIGETEYEIGASLRNPYEKPEVFASAQAVERRLKIYESRLNLNFKRALEWGFAQAVLSAIWAVEDSFPVDCQNLALLLAEAIQPMLE